MSTKPYQWGEEHFCEPDVVQLNTAEPDLKHTLGFPVQLDGNPTPPTFCSACLRWFDDPAHLTGSDHRPPEQGGTHA